MEPSPLLATVATSLVPGAAAAALMGWIAAALVLRMVLLLERSRLDWAVAILVSAMLATAVLRDRAAQAVLTPWLSLADIRLATHIAALSMAGALLWVGLLWQGQKPVSWRTAAWIIACVAVLGATLAWLSVSARSANIAIEELHDWRTPAYMMVYSLPTPLAEVPMLVTFVGLLRCWRQSLPRAVFGGVATVCITLSMVDSGSRVLSAWLHFAGVHNSFTTGRAASNDWLFLVPVAGFMLMTIPSIVVSATIRLRRDRASRNIRILSPMWADMMAARPETRLHVHVRNSLPQVTEHRMWIEIEDVTISAAPWLTCLGTQPTPAQVCAALRSALSDGAVGGGDRDARAPEWIDDEKFILEVAREWQQGVPSSPLSVV
ncbi:DUF6545 domain-containing protein [Nocardia altamirensis]|uniref:DUF6545 domain-containing protein n=1 Tax=Nocardia altamirensis TaxID=472158 RepID=UPI000840482A|nr:DUF6545 domain-containing protein [Nocardia altamirensis]